MAQNSNTQYGCGPKLCSVCGTNIDTAGVSFSRTEANLVYMDKVYSHNKATACPLLVAVPATTDWTTELVMKENDDCDCCCGTLGCILTSEAVFTVTRSYVLVSSLTLAAGTITAADVTVDGIAVDALTETGNRYSAETGALVAQINRKRCQELGLPSKNFFLITDSGPWTFIGTIVLEGTVNTGGKTCCFQLKFNTPEAGTAIAGTSTFAIPKLALPCTVNGVSPTIEFSFGGQVNVLNPDITVTTAADTGTITLGLTGSLAVQPQLNVQVVRRTLFCIQASEALLPCDGTKNAYELEDENCTWPPAPACSCGTGTSPMNMTLNQLAILDNTPQCNFDSEGRCIRCGKIGCNGNCHSGCDSDYGCGCNAGNTGNYGTDCGCDDGAAFQWNGCNGCSW